MSGTAFRDALADFPGDAQPPPPCLQSWPRSIGEEARIGLVGDFIRTLEPHTESDLSAVLIQFLAAFGNCVGSAPSFLVERTLHTTRLFLVVVGESSKARKGTGWDNVRGLFNLVDEFWTKRIASGLSTGEGLIWNVRDPIVKVGKDGEEQVVDAGESDKRALIVESEFGSVLKVGNRETNTLTAVIRDAWDKPDLRTMTKNSPAKATGAHLSIIGHITLPELRRTLASTDCLNGFANRFLWVCARRSKLLPEGGAMDEAEFHRVAKALRLALDDAREVKKLTRSEQARELWIKVYPELTADRSGVFGAVTSRSEAQVLRISMIYALLDGTALITERHLRAALEVWRYCEESAQFIFWEKLENPNAQTIQRALLTHGENGMSRSEISDLFQRHLSKAEIDSALNSLGSLGLAHSSAENTGGRATERWFPGAKKAK